VEIRKEELEVLGPIHRGRKMEQPPKKEVARFYGEAEPLLDHERLWFNEAMRVALGQAFGEGAGRHGYTVYALAVGRNHVHGVVRAHRDRAAVIWTNLARATRESLREARLIPEGHPLWADRPYKVFLMNNKHVETCIGYVEENLAKAGLGAQKWGFVVPYQRVRGW